MIKGARRVSGPIGGGISGLGPLLPATAHYSSIGPAQRKTGRHVSRVHSFVIHALVAELPDVHNWLTPRFSVSIVAAWGIQSEASTWHQNAIYLTSSGLRRNSLPNGKPIMIGLLPNAAT